MDMRSTTAVVLLGLALLAAACGGSDTGSADPVGSDTPARSDLPAPSGAVEVDLASGSVSHCMSQAGFAWVGRDVDVLELVDVIGPLESEYLAAVDQYRFAEVRGYSAALGIANALNVPLEFVPAEHREVLAYASDEYREYESALSGADGSGGCYTLFQSLLRPPPYEPEAVAEVIESVLTADVLSALELERDSCIRAALPNHAGEATPEAVRVATLAEAIDLLQSAGSSPVLSIDQNGEALVSTDPESGVDLETLTAIHRIEVHAATAVARCHLRSFVVPGLELVLETNGSDGAGLDLAALETWMKVEKIND